MRQFLKNAFQRATLSREVYIKNADRTVEYPLLCSLKIRNNRIKN